MNARNETARILFDMLETAMGGVSDKEAKQAIRRTFDDALRKFADENYEWRRELLDKRQK